jgi:2-oxoglutarate dehydrogenase E2 component (dihydrolipoamide succinyltransferase)
MSSNVEVPALGESISEAILVRWYKREGDRVAVDEAICELESDKATVDLPAPVGGVLHPVKAAGETVQVGEIIARINETDAPAGVIESSQVASTQIIPPQQNESAARSEAAAKKSSPETLHEPKPAPPPKSDELLVESSNRVGSRAVVEASSAAPQSSTATEGIRRVPMSRMRLSIAERMVRAQQTSAMLTTFNEVDMTAVQELRREHQERFKKAHGFSLGLVSFFAWASALALKQFPILNAQLDGHDIVYHDHVHLGVAVSTERGLVVPVLRNVESLSLPRIEAEIKRVAAAARDGKLSITDLSGGTFTITNGGIFGSLLSTPILNPPQTAILGMHAIQDRPVAIQGHVHIRPMMYVALSYDHRLADGQDAVSFLVRIKQVLEDPIQMLLEI